MCHAHATQVFLRDDRQSPPAIEVTRILCLHAQEEITVDQINDLQMPGQQPLVHGDRPRLERLGQQGMVRVRKHPARDAPGGIPAEAVLVDEQAHEFGNGYRRVGVI
jgi:hypothetical protein